MDWKPCADIAAGWDAEDRATECATVTVPLDHGNPGGRTIDLAVSRFRAAEHAEGVVVLNPGGPGQQGVTMPRHVRESRAAGIGARHDLIGFDPRGIGYSAGIECEPPDVEPDPSSSAKDKARVLAEADAARNRECAAGDPELTRSLIQQNVARDVDLIREALGVEQIGFYGESWGTALGATYRTLFDDRVSAMVLDSVMSPDQGVGELDDGQTGAAEAAFHRFADWVVGRYPLGDSGSEVRERVLDLRDELDAHPRTALDGSRIDGMTVATLATGPRANRAQAAEQLVVLAEGGVPETGPWARAGGLGWDREASGMDRFAQTALLCNTSDSPREFEGWWRSREERAERYPLAGGLGMYEVRCVGWDVPQRALPYGAGTSPLLLVGHAEEQVTPHPWAVRMREVIGGELLTVDDERHASFKSLPCAEIAVRLFDGGEVEGGTCAG
ncbi:alpha/beta hydrolase [Actinosynnema pretiosum subsp. pretiosum]